jgi:hypothetical protein
MSVQPIHVTVVGHTNTGKTSLLRTLTRNVDFGDISSRPGTTRHVEGTMLLLDDEPALALYDTPGLEDSITLLELLERQSGHGQAAAPDGPDRLQRFLQSAAARGDLEQESKVLRQVLGSDVVLYVIDARETVLGKHRDELTVLTLSAKPVIPVLNFVASPDSREAEWREQLARINLHAVVAYDTVLLDPGSERRLFEAMQALLPAHYARLQQLIEQARRTREGQRRAATAALADMLIDVAALQLGADPADTDTLTGLGEDLRTRVRRREQNCVQTLLAIFAFRPGDADADELPVKDGRWQWDLFSAETLREFGLHAGSGAAKGAAIGLGVDLVTGGLSLGLAAAIGATIGAAWQTAGRFGKRLLARLRGHALVQVDDNTLRILTHRQLQLIAALLDRGHAGLTVMKIGVPADAGDALALPPMLARARRFPQWSRLAGGAEGSGTWLGIAAGERATLQTSLQTWLDTKLPSER